MRARGITAALIVAGAVLTGCSSGDAGACREAADLASSGFTKAMENWKWFSATGADRLLLVSDAKDQYNRAVAIEQGDYTKFLAAYSRCSGEPAPQIVQGRTPPPAP